MGNEGEIQQLQISQILSEPGSELTQKRTCWMHRHSAYITRDQADRLEARCEGVVKLKYEETGKSEQTYRIWPC